MIEPRFDCVADRCAAVDSVSLDARGERPASLALVMSVSSCRVLPYTDNCSVNTRGRQHVCMTSLALVIHTWPARGAPRPLDPLGCQVVVRCAPVVLTGEE